MMKCKTCGHLVHPGCDYNQGRCGHRPPIINTHSMRFYNLFQSIKNVFSRKNKN